MPSAARAMTHKSHGRLVFVLTITTACSGGSGDSDSGGTGADGSDDGQEEAPDGGDADETAAPPEAEFIVPVDFGGPQFECDPWNERTALVSSDCPSGEKCVPIASDDGPVWNATACVTIDLSPVAVGAPCTATTPGTLGDDNCEQGAICWHVGGDGDGVCIAMCSLDSNPTHRAAEGHCESAPGVHCVTGNGGVIDLCLPTCNPLPTATSGCDSGSGCYPIHHGFTCAPSGGPPALPAPRELGDPCEYVNDCASGLFCLDAAVQPVCPAERCCAEYCDVAAVDPCTAPGAECIAWFDEGTEIPDVADLGMCAATALPYYPNPGFVAHSAWNCIATEGLLVVQTSCSGEPISGECDIGDVEEDFLPLPEVVNGPNDTFEGWVVHAPWVRAPLEPTAADLAGILERCISTCELEYADDPFVSAACRAAEAFDEPTLNTTDDVGVYVAISDAFADGNGLFVGESLACDLRSNCSLEFDENLGPARSRRLSLAGAPLHRGEEWLLSITGEMEAGSSYAVPQLLSDASAEMRGTVGYSRCATGNATTCPFYLGSMEVELLEPLQLDLECDSVLQSHELTELRIRLAQPAFGIAEEGTSWNGFPPGGLVLEAEGVVDEAPFTSRRAIEQPVYVYAADGLLTVQGSLDGFVIGFEVPCNGLMADVEVGWGFVEDQALEGPPALGIGHLPATMSCPDELPLTLEWADDPEGDYASLQWIVDGILLEGEWPTLTMTESHDITAVLRDSRGATRSATTTVACQ
jgi:hypothetical protein